VRSTVNFLSASCLPIWAGAIAPLAGPLFNEYLLAFEVTSVLLLAAVVGAVVLGKRKERTRAH